MTADRTADGMKPRWMTVPLTLAAAMIAVVIAGGILLTMSGLATALRNSG